MPKLSKILIIITLVLAFIAIVFASFWLLTKNKRQIPIVTTTTTQQQQNLSFNINTDKNSINVNDKIEVSVYLNGSSAVDVNAFDIKINYDKTKLKLISATHGMFFNKDLEVKWSIPQAWFSLARSPSQNLSYPNSPLITFEFEAISKTGSTTISLDPSSSVYVSKSGSLSPTGNKVTFTIN